MSDTPTPPPTPPTATSAPVKHVYIESTADYANGDVDLPPGERCAVCRCDIRNAVHIEPRYLQNETYMGTLVSARLRVTHVEGRNVVLFDFEDGARVVYVIEDRHGGLFDHVMRQLAEILALVHPRETLPDLSLEESLPELCGLKYIVDAHEIVSKRNGHTYTAYSWSRA